MALFSMQTIRTSSKIDSGLGEGSTIWEVRKTFGLQDGHFFVNGDLMGDNYVLKADDKVVYVDKEALNTLVPLTQPRA